MNYKIFYALAHFNIGIYSTCEYVDSKIMTTVYYGLLQITLAYIEIDVNKILIGERSL